MQEALKETIRARPPVFPAGPLPGRTAAFRDTADAGFIE